MKKKEKRSTLLPLIAIVISMLAITVLVALGGTQSIAVHFFYLPIVYAGFVFGDYGAIAASLWAAFLCGPWMPARIEPAGTEVTRIMQSPWDIALRAGIFYVLGIFASRVSGALRRRTSEAETLYEVARNISSSLRLREVLDAIVNHAVAVMDARACSIRLLDEESGELKPEASAGLSEQYWDKGPVTVEGSELDRRVLAGEAVAILDAQKDPLFQYPEAAREEGLTSVLSSPLRSKEKTLGVIRMYAHRRRRFRRHEVELLSAFADQAAIAIENAQLYEDIRQNYYETVRALTIAIEARDSATYSHSERVTELADELAAELGMSEQERELLRFGAILHDIGKIGVGEQVLDSRDGPLEDQMFYRMHPLIGRSILQPIAFLAPVMSVVVHHHERWDGQGFPEGLSGEDIPYRARLVAVVDAYERAVHPTESPSPVSPQEALHQVVAGAGTAFDPEIVAAFARMMRRGPAGQSADETSDEAPAEDAQAQPVEEDREDQQTPPGNGDLETGGGEQVG